MEWKLCLSICQIVFIDSINEFLKFSSVKRPAHVSDIEVGEARNVFTQNLSVTQNYFVQNKCFTVLTMMRGKHLIKLNRIVCRIDANHHIFYLKYRYGETNRNHILIILLRLRSKSVLSLHRTVK